jgi:capsular polysaccharide biosynthesis protein
MVVIGCNYVSTDSYFHWITQALPAIDFTLGRADQERRIRLALPVLTQWQEDSLRLLGYSGVSRVSLTDPSKQYSFNRVEYSELLRGEATFRWSETIHRTFSRLRAAVDQVRHEGRKLYVARTNAPRRVMRNEGSIVAELQQRGFEIVTPDILSLAEQVRLFRDASLIVGPHGAGMTNIVFCEPGTIVYELLSTHYRNACFCSLAHVCGLRYWADAFDSEGEGTPFLRDWESDTTLVMQRVTEIEAIQADLREEARQTISAMDFLRGFVGP